MKNTLFILLLALTLSCSNEDERCEDLAHQYATSLQNANGSQSAINELTRQYEEKRREYGCD